MKYTWFLILLCLWKAIPVHSQDYPYPRLNGSFIISGFRDSRDLMLSPIHWKGKQWIGLGVVAGAGFLTYSNDRVIRDFFQSHQDKTTTDISRYGLEPWGSGIYSVPFLGGMYLIGRISANDRTSATALTAGKAALITSVLVQVTKQLTHRHRPFQDDPASPNNWDGPISDWHYNSFPSGHSAFTFAIASVIASEYKTTTWVPVLCYSIATATALSRIYQDRHWASDVLIGSAVGYFSGRFLWKLNRNINIIPVGGKSVVGVSVSIPI